MCKYAQLKWQCRRGTKELDLVLTHYLEHHYPQANNKEQSAFKQLLSLEDPVLADLIAGNKRSDTPHQHHLINTLRQFAMRQTL
jgi:antitoxin CptB